MIGTTGTIFTLLAFAQVPGPTSSEVPSNTIAILPDRPLKAASTIRISPDGPPKATSRELVLDLNTRLMRSTFKIEGEGSMGTAFILGKPTTSDPARAHPVLVTAAHVLTAMKGESAVLFLRVREGDGYRKHPFPIRIRNGSKDLWTKHPSGDVAVMFVTLPQQADLLAVSTNMLADDDMLRDEELRPGDRLTCLGFPLAAESSPAGFPVLRSGYVASYPLLPTASVKTFLLDFNVFPGNSGGPVFLVETNRASRGAVLIGTTQLLVGLVSQQQIQQELVQSQTERRVLQHRLGLAVVVHGTLIREALALLQPQPR